MDRRKLSVRVAMATKVCHRGSRVASRAGNRVLIADNNNGRILSHDVESEESQEWDTDSVSQAFGGWERQIRRRYRPSRT